MTLLAKRAGLALTMAAVQAGAVRMVLCRAHAADRSGDDWSEAARDIYPPWCSSRIISARP